jgi:hypothetical protein
MQMLQQVLVEPAAPVGEAAGARPITRHISASWLRIMVVKLEIIA